MADKSSDPIAVWHSMLGEMEKGFNTFANQAMAHPEFSKAMNQAGGAAAGAQKQVGDLMEKYLAGMNMPSRQQMTAFGERLQAIESQLAEITSILRDMTNAAGRTDPAAPPRPPRTRQPTRRDGDSA